MASRARRARPDGLGDRAAPTDPWRVWLPDPASLTPRRMDNRQPLHALVPNSATGAVRTARSRQITTDLRPIGPQWVACVLPPAQSSSQASWQCYRSAQILQGPETRFPRHSFQAHRRSRSRLPAKLLSTAVEALAPALRAPGRRGFAPSIPSHPVQLNATKPASALALTNQNLLKSLSRQTSRGSCPLRMFTPRSWHRNNAPPRRAEGPLGLSGRLDARARRTLGSV